MFYVYFLRSRIKPDQCYIGYTTDLKKRLKRHNNKEVLSTKPYAPWEIIFYEAYKSKKDAKRREKYLKTTKGRKGLKLMLRDSLL
ncbi:GIY-YIG nuclease family protein [Candidatus Falkowbacteria bacterium]|nr:GIY-YIG nuclease family protein [Candidatus Falkowbacteria bacterium]